MGTPTTSIPTPACGGALPGVFQVFAGGSQLNGIALWRQEGHPAYVRTVAEWGERDPRTAGVAEALRAGGELADQHAAECRRRLDAHLAQFGHT